MCRILDDFVLVRMSASCTLGSRKNDIRTSEIQARTGNSSAVVTEKLFPKDTFVAFRSAITEAKSVVNKWAVAATIEGERMVHIAKINDVRRAESECASKLAIAATNLRYIWTQQVIPACATMRGSDFRREQYPDDPPLEEWFNFKVAIRPHPKQGALSESMAGTQTDLERELRESMASEFDVFVANARQDLMSRVSDTVGAFGRKMMVLRADCYECEQCHFQWEQSKGHCCPRCSNPGGKRLRQEKNVFSSMWDHLRELAETLDVMLPDEVTHGMTTAAVMAPIMMDPSEVKSASPSRLMHYENTARTVAENLGSLIAQSFATSGKEG